mmetsp:Transcript_33288/g.70002  ORF Transcript_33288/g.70002 Transcript_33288/m.70002 type:complete len:101 (+) Transcript_33288:152-454(+)
MSILFTSTLSNTAINRSLEQPTLGENCGIIESEGVLRKVNTNENWIGVWERTNRGICNNLHKGCYNYDLLYTPIMNHGLISDFPGTHRWYASHALDPSPI